jgi:hypothetical protein
MSIGLGCHECGQTVKPGGLSLRLEGKPLETPFDVVFCPEHATSVLRKLRIPFKRDEPPAAKDRPLNKSRSRG